MIYLKVTAFWKCTYLTCMDLGFKSRKQFLIQDPEKFHSQSMRMRKTMIRRKKRRQIPLPMMRKSELVPQFGKE